MKTGVIKISPPRFGVIDRTFIQFMLQWHARNIMVRKNKTQQIRNQHAVSQRHRVGMAKKHQTIELKSFKLKPDFKSVFAKFCNHEAINRLSSFFN